MLDLITENHFCLRKDHGIWGFNYCHPKGLYFLHNQVLKSTLPGLGMTLNSSVGCCPQYDVKLMWRHQGNDTVSVAAICVAAICAAAQLIFLFGRTRLAVYQLSCVLGRWIVFRITCNRWCTTAHFRCRSESENPTYSCQYRHIFHFTFSHLMSSFVCHMHVVVWMRTKLKLN